MTPERFAEIAASLSFRGLLQQMQIAFKVKPTGKPLGPSCSVCGSTAFSRKWNRPEETAI